jgi:uncharacterized protein YdeI (YjbR/CyaY-like superfamily)
MNKVTLQVDGYIRKHKQWQQELQELRKIILASPLTEEVKWRVPCYTFEDHNVVFLGAFKESCAISFVKGVLLKDARKILQLPGPDTQSVRVVKFTNVQDIVAVKSTLKAYILEAVEVEKSGVKPKLKQISERPIPEEFKKKLAENAALKTAFKALTPGRQRMYLMHFAGAKQSQTRESRIEKCVPRILSGKGLND